MARIGILVVVALALSAPAESQRRGPIIQGRGRGVARSVWDEIQGGGHRWPPRQATTPAEKLAARMFGVSSQNIDATETLWQFFKTHSKP